MPRNPPVAKHNWERFKPDSHKCVDCGAVFNDSAQPAQLDSHVRTKHAGMRFVCPHCPRTFAWKRGLSEHVRFTHQKLARYRCETCGKRYAHRSNYYDHLATHTGVKRNVCPVCMKGFTFRHNMKAHMSRVHADDTVADSGGGPGGPGPPLLKIKKMTKRVPLVENPQKRKRGPPF